MNNIQALDRVLTNKGYAIRKSSLQESELANIRKQLTVMPVTNAKFAAAAQENSFPLFYESPQRIYLPRQWALQNFGVPQANIVPDGEDLPEACQFAGKPYDYQINIIDKFIQAGGNGLICVPCGKGKTFMALAIAARLKKRFCIVVDKEFLLNQWKGEIEAFFPGVRVGIFQRDKIQTQTEIIQPKEPSLVELKQKAKDANLKVTGTKQQLMERLQAANVKYMEEPEVVSYDCTICMIQTIVQKEIPSNSFDGFGFTIFDECHHLGAQHFSRALMKIQTKWMLGLSATPQREDGLTKVFEMFLGPPVYWEKTREPDATVSVLVRSFHYEDLDYAEAPVDWKGEVIMARLLGKVVDYKPRTKAIATIISAWIQESTERRVLVLSERKSHLEEFEELLKPLGVEIGYYIGGMKDTERDASAANARIILATYAMASEAMNIKTLNAVVLASPRKRVEQSTGRILRVRPEHRNLEHRILDFIDSHDLYMGQWRKRLAYYKQCHYNIFQLDDEGNRTKMAGPSAAKPLDLSVCQFSDD
jgi:superfamily II DNA or RNA helicase